MRRPSGFVVYLLLGALAVAMCGGGVFLYVTRMPDPATADLHGLFRWLVTRDLSNEPLEVQQQILERLEGELKNGLQIGKASEGLTEIQREKLIENADLLGRLWFLNQVDRYFAHPAAERLGYLNQQIDEIQRIGIAETLAALVPNQLTSGPKNMWVSLNERIQRWTARLDPGRKAQAEQFVAAVQGNLFLRTLKASFPLAG